MTDTTNPEIEAEFEPAEIEGVETDQSDGIDDQADEGDENEADEGSPSDDEEEVEINGKTYRIPKAVQAERMMEADYRRKTQEAAEAVRRFDEERASWQQASEDHLQAKIETKAVKDRLGVLHGLSEADWHQIRAMDAQDGTDRYNALMRELNVLPTKLVEAENKSKAAEDAVIKQQSEARTKLLEQGQAELQRDIPGWGPELGAKLVDFVRSEFGITPERHGKAFEDPALVKMAHAAFKAGQTKLKTQTQQRAEKAQTNRPAHVARTGTAPSTGLNDRMGAKDWVEKRNAQLAAKGR